MPQDLAWTVQEVVAATRVGRATVYRAISDGELRVVRIGRRGRIVVPVASVTEWLERMTAEPSEAKSE